MNINTYKSLTIFKNIFKEDENKRTINIYKVENSTLLGHSIYYPDVLLKTENQLIIPLLERTMSLKIGSIYEQNNMTYSFNISDIEITNINTNPLFFFIYNTDNYYHFIYDSLPYLISYLELKKTIPNLKLLMQYPNSQKTNFYPFNIELLKLLSIDIADIIIANNNTRYSEIYVSTSYTHDIDSNLPPRKEIYAFYQSIVCVVKNKYPINATETPPKIYISRRTWLHNDYSNIGTNYTTRRKMVNEDQFVEKVVADGYIEVFTENLSTIQKILYFSNATHIIGAIGGGIANVLFSNKDTLLEALISPTFLDVNNRFRYCLDCVNVTYNFNTEHIENSDFKTYMRVKTLDGKIIGEIDKVYDDRLLVSYTDGSNTGWNSQNTYKKIELKISNVEKLDNGLNSNWKLIF
jgi:hypothetical protein